jgi:starch phosphorylase
MRESMARLTPRFSTNRVVREYTEQHYLPAASAYRHRVADKGAVGMQIVEWQHAVYQNWGSVRFGDVRVETDADHHVVEVEISLNGLEPNMVRVELYADAVDGGEATRKEMTWARTLPNTVRRSVYQATLPVTRPASEYTARVMPHRSGVAVPLECARILWQR